MPLFRAILMIFFAVIILKLGHVVIHCYDEYLRVFGILFLFILIPVGTTVISDMPTLFPKHGTISVHTKNGVVSYDVSESQVEYNEDGEITSFAKDDGTVITIRDTYELKWN